MKLTNAKFFLSKKKFISPLNTSFLLHVNLIIFCKTKTQKEEKNNTK